MKFLFTNKKISRNLPFFKKNKFHFSTFSEYTLITDDCNTLFEDDNILGVVDGYLKDLNVGIQHFKSQTLSALKRINTIWPPPSNITGSFSGFQIDKNTKAISIFTDVINTYPLYYLIKDDSIIISNSILLIGGISKEEIDQTGVFQKAVGPFFMNIGSRTTINNCKRLLPGECLRISNERKIKHLFDNELYQNIAEPDPSPQIFIDTLKKEIKYLSAGKNNIHIALSGGLDSRILLGGIPRNKKIISHTYGNKKNYENKIASRLTAIYGGNHNDYYDPTLYFPEKKVFEKYIYNTEAVKFPAWLEILENVKLRQEKEVLLIGDMCESLVARNIKTFSSSTYRKKKLLKSIRVTNKDSEFHRSSSKSFEEWKKKVSDISLSWHGDNWFKRLDLTDKKNEIIQNSKSDLDEIFERIAAHDIPYTELYDEIFGWFTKSRNLMSQQILICNHSFFAVCPTMSNGLIKLTSNIHPNSRLHNGYINRLFKDTSELKELGKIPTSQIPLIPHNFSDFLKLPIWAIRSWTDDYLIKRILKKRNPKLKYRLLRSQNWIEIYQQPNMLEKYNSYFVPNKLTNGYRDIFYELAKKRRNLMSWPFSNVNLISAASINLELNMRENINKEFIDSH